MLLHIKQPRIQREHPVPSDHRNPKLPRRQSGGHEAADRENCDLNRELRDRERFGTVREELVEESEETAGEDSERPHSECPDRERGIVGVEDRESDLLDRRDIFGVGVAVIGGEGVVEDRSHGGDDGGGGGEVGKRGRLRGEGDGFVRAGGCVVGLTAKFMCPFVMSIDFGLYQLQV
ncbi:hypothetical protein AKJ16_DCAP06261 [Drosera capensis]